MDVIGNSIEPEDDTLAQPVKTQAEANYREVSGDPARHCSICQHYLGAGLCKLVEGQPAPIVENGVSDLFEAVESEKEIGEMANPTRGYVSLAVRWAWEVERLQDALMTIFGYNEDWNWHYASTLHVTLAYSDNVTDEQLIEAAKAAVGHEAITLKFTGIGVFVNGERQSVYLKIEENAELRALQKAIYDSLSAQKVVMSEFSPPAAWVPHMTIFDTPAGVVMPSPELEIEAYCIDCVKFQREDYMSLLDVTLKMPESMAYRNENGTGPVAEMASWKTGSPSGLDVVEGDPAWDGSAAAKSVFDAAGFGGDSPDVMMARKAFLVYNASAPKLRGSYKLGVAKMVDGELKLVPAGVRQAASRISQVKGVPQDVIDKAQKMLDACKKKAGVGMDDKPEKAAMATEMEHGRTPIRLSFISEMRGNPPHIRLPEDIDLEELRKVTGEQSLDFVTLPIGQVDAVSRNGRTYRRAAVEELVAQVNDHRPEGMWGHLSDEERGTRYDPPAIRWLAAMIDKNDIAWGKGLPLTAETRDYYRIAKATRAKVATSLTALAEMNNNDVEHLELNTIDIADPMRVGILATVSAVQLTQEMAKGAPARDAVPLSPSHDVLIRVRETNSQDKEKPMLTEEQISELQTSENALKARVTELEGEKGTLVQRVTELEGREKAFVTEIGILLGEYIEKEVQEAVALPNWRKRIVKDVVREQPQSRDAVKEVLKRVLDDADTQEAMKATVVEMMGPKQTTPDSNGNKDGTPAAPSKYLIEVPEGE